MTKKFIALLLALILTLACLAGCAAKDQTTAPEETAKTDTAADAVSGEKAYKLAFISSMISDEAVKYFGEMAAEEAAAHGSNVTVFDPNADAQKQTSMVDACIADGYDAIMLTAVDPVAIVPAVKRASEAGIPVVMVMCDIDDSGKEYRIASVTSEHYGSGVYAAENIIAQFPDGAKGVAIEGHPGEDTTVKRHDGFLNTIEGTNIELIDSKGCNGWDSTLAISVMEDFISKYGDEIDYVFCQWDYGAAAVSQLLEEKGLSDKIYVVSIDGCKAGFELVKEGKIGATMFQDVKAQGITAVDLILDYLNEGKLENETVDIGWEVITKDNCDDYNPGW